MHQILFTDLITFPTSGQINASLTSFSRTVDDYNKLAKQELIPAKQELAYERVKTFRSELADYRAQLERLKQIIDEQVKKDSLNFPFKKK